MKIFLVFGCNAIIWSFFCTFSTFMHIECTFFWISNYLSTMYWIDILVLQWLEILSLSCTIFKLTWFCEQLTKILIFPHKLNAWTTELFPLPWSKRARRVKGFSRSPMTTVKASLDLRTHFSYVLVFFSHSAANYDLRWQKVGHFCPLSSWLFFSNRRSV